MSSITKQSSPCDQDIMSGHEAAVSDVTLVTPQSERERERKREREREREREYAEVHQITACSSCTVVPHVAHRPVYSGPACGTPPSVQWSRMWHTAQCTAVLHATQCTAVPHAAHCPVYSGPACGTPPSVQRSCMHSVYDGPHSLPVEARLIHEVPHNDISVL